MHYSRLRIHMKQKKSIILLVVPVIIATLIVVFQLIPPQTIGYYADTYTVAVLFVLLALTLTGAAVDITKEG